jgi:hypothetical protein
MEAMTMDAALRLVQIAVLLGSVGVNVWLWRRNNNDKTLEALRANDADLSRKFGDFQQGSAQHIAASVARDAGLEIRVVALETTVRHMPTHGDLQAIQRELRDLNGTVSVVSERSEATMQMMRTIQEHLMEAR